MPGSWGIALLAVPAAFFLLAWRDLASCFINRESCLLERTSYGAAKFLGGAYTGQREHRKDQSIFSQVLAANFPP
jgi:hypothetical protein